MWLLFFPQLPARCGLYQPYNPPRSTPLQEAGRLFHHRPLKGYGRILIQCVSCCFTGNIIVNVVPFPTWLETYISPWWVLVISLHILNPSPVPLFRSLVVKKGPKIFCRLASSIPCPLSLIVTVTDSLLRTSLWLKLVFTSNSPLPGIASIALVSKLRNSS